MLVEEPLMQRSLEFACVTAITLSSHLIPCSVSLNWHKNKAIYVNSLFLPSVWPMLNEPQT